MNKLRYSEAFYSVQGEGKFVGVPSVFLRTFGCNFRCINFGLPRGTPMRETGVKYNPEVRKLLDDGITSKTEKFEDLPIVHTGCDTYASIYPEFKKYMMDRTADEVVDHLLSLIPEGKWTMNNGQDIHLVITGGEPLLGWQRFWQELLEHPRMRDLKNVTFETNATQSFLAVAISITAVAFVSPVASAPVCEGPHISKDISTDSVSENFSYAVAISALVAAKSSVPLASELVDTAKASPAALSKV